MLYRARDAKTNLAAAKSDRDIDHLGSKERPSKLFPAATAGVESDWVGESPATILIPSLRNRVTIYASLCYK